MAATLQGKITSEDMLPVNFESISKASGAFEVEDSDSKKNGGGAATQAVLPVVAVATGLIGAVLGTLIGTLVLPGDC